MSTSSFEEKAVGSVSRITSLEDHRALLRRVFETAKERIIIVSPFISKSALDADHVTDLFRNAVSRGVPVSVYTDSELNRGADGMVKDSAVRGVNALVKSGAKVIIVPNVHSKTLIRDEDLIAEGSFNWLSAVRRKGAEHQREERTMVAEGVGKEVRDMVRDEVGKLGEVSAGGGRVVAAATKETRLDKRNVLRFYGYYIAAVVVFAVVSFFLYEANLISEGASEVAAWCAGALFFGSIPVILVLAIKSTGGGANMDSSEGMGAGQWETTPAISTDYASGLTDLTYIGGVGVGDDD